MLLHHGNQPVLAELLAFPVLRLRNAVAAAGFQVANIEVLRRNRRYIEAEPW